MSRNVSKAVEQFHKIAEKNPNVYFSAADYYNIRDASLEKDGSISLFDAIYNSLMVGFIAGNNYAKREAKKTLTPAG